MATELVRENVGDRLKSLLGKLEQRAPEETKEISALVKAIEEKSIAVLGEDEAFKLADSAGEIRAFRSAVHLSASDGTLTHIGDNGDFFISAQGYERWEEAAGAITIKPPSVMVNGREETANPYPERDSVTGRIIAYHCRTIAFRFTSKGIPQVSDWTTIFDIVAYRLIDLLAKAKKYPQAFKLLPSGITPENSEKITWAKYIFDESTNLFVNTSHDEGINFYSQIINREKKGADFAQTFSKRNALKHLSGLQHVPGQEQKPVSRWSISVTSWRPTTGSIIKWDQTRYANVTKALMEASGGNTGALMLEATTGRELSSVDPGVQKEIEELDLREIDETGDPAGTTGQAEGPKPPAEGPKEPGDPPPPSEPPPVKEKTKENSEKTVKTEGKGTYMEQVTGLYRADSKLYYQACKEVEINEVMSEASALTVLRKADEISKRPKGKK